VQRIIIIKLVDRTDIQFGCLTISLVLKLLRVAEEPTEATILLHNRATHNRATHNRATHNKAINKDIRNNRHIRNNSLFMFSNNDLNGAILDIVLVGKWSN
jgi:hypothetical protein